MTIRKKTNSGRISLDLTGPDGNAYVLLGTAQRLYKDLVRNEVIRPFEKPDGGYYTDKEVLDEMKSGDYEHLVETFDRFFGDFVDLYR